MRVLMEIKNEKSAGDVLYYSGQQTFPRLSKRAKFEDSWQSTTAVKNR